MWSVCMYLSLYRIQCTMKCDWFPPIELLCSFMIRHCHANINKYCCCRKFNKRKESRKMLRAVCFLALKNSWAQFGAYSIEGCVEWLTDWSPWYVYLVWCWWNVDVFFVFCCFIQIKEKWQAKSLTINNVWYQSFKTDVIYHIIYSRLMWYDISFCISLD